jgi:hypothetical protein
MQDFAAQGLNTTVVYSNLDTYNEIRAGLDEKIIQAREEVLGEEQVTKKPISKDEACIICNWEGNIYTTDEEAGFNDEHTLKDALGFPESNARLFHMSHGILYEQNLDKELLRIDPESSEIIPHDLRFARIQTTEKTSLQKRRTTAALRKANKKNATIHRARNAHDQASTKQNIDRNIPRNR